MKLQNSSLSDGNICNNADQVELQLKKSTKSKGGELLSTAAAACVGIGQVYDLDSCDTEQLVLMRLWFDLHVDER